MKQKNLIFTACMLFCFSLTSFSQSNQKMAFAIQGGANFQNLTGKDYLGDELDNTLLPGFHAGLNVIFPIAPDFYVQPGLLFSAKGAKNTNSSETVKTKLSYVELPINLLYRAQLRNGKVLLGFGPYLGYGITGKVVVGDNETDIEFKSKIESGDPIMVPYYKPLDMGANIYFGYETAMGIYFQLNSQLGLVDVNPEDERIQDNDASIKNTGFGLSLGFRF